jgi:hypothetical protein
MVVFLAVMTGYIGQAMIQYDLAIWPIRMLLVAVAAASLQRWLLRRLAAGKPDRRSSRG